MKRAAPKIAHSQSDARASHNDQDAMTAALRSEEHTSELQSP